MNYKREEVTGKMRRFLGFLTLLMCVTFGAVSRAETYSCPTYMRYVSCAQNYYLNSTSVGNACVACPEGNGWKSTTSNNNSSTSCNCPSGYWNASDHSKTTVVSGEACISQSVIITINNNGAPGTWTIHSGGTIVTQTNMEVEISCTPGTRVLFSSKPAKANTYSYYSTTKDGGTPLSKITCPSDATTYYLYWYCNAGYSSDGTATGNSHITSAGSCLPISRQITCNSSTAATSGMPQTVSHGQTSITVPQKPGYPFKGAVLDCESNSALHDFCTYNNGGDPVILIAEDGTVDDFEDRGEGWTFDYWVDETGHSPSSYEEPIPFICEWGDPITSTVSFNANGGSGGQSANVTATYDAAMPTIDTTKPTLTGYEFMGWYDNATYTSGTQYYTAAGASARTWDKTSNTTLYAGWKLQGGIECAEGYYLPSGTTTCNASCPQGKYCSGGSFSFNASSDQGINGSVSAGYYSVGGCKKSNPTATSDYVTGGNCGVIKAGYWGAAGATTNEGSGKVDAGYFSTGGGTSKQPSSSGCLSGYSCGVIKAGYYGVAGASTDEGSGQVAAGYYSTGGATTDKPVAASGGCLTGYDCGLCDANSYSTGGGTSHTCTPCSVPAYACNGNEYGTSICADGTTIIQNATQTLQNYSQTCYRTTSEAGSTSHDSCGGEVKNNDKTWLTCFIVECETGYHKTLTTSWSCEVNTFNISYDAGGGSGTAPTTPTSCTYGDTSCTAPANTYSKSGHNFAGWACTKGDNTSCGTFAADASIATATATNGDTITLTATWSIESNISCSAGYYLPAGSTACNTKCPEGKYCAGGGSYTYNATSDQGISGICGDNQWSDEGASACSSCPGSMTNSGNSASDHAKKSSCKITCAEKTFLDKGGSTCSPCTAGYYCTGGTNLAYSDTNVQGRNGVCDTNTYSDEGTASTKTCTACPNGMTTSGTNGSDHAHKSSCKITCGAGTYLAANTSSCALCPAGKYCNGGTFGFSSTDQGVSGNVAAGYYSVKGCKVQTPSTSNDIATGGDCGVIAAGYWGANGATSNHGSGQVDAGYYSTGGAKSSTPVSASGGCLTGYDCGKCQAGSFSTGGATAKTCTPCTSATFDCGGTDTTNTSTCPDDTTTKSNATGTSQAYSRTCNYAAESPEGSTTKEACTKAYDATKNYSTCYVTSCASGYHKNANSTSCDANTFSVAYNAGSGGTGTAPTTPTSCTYADTCIAPTNTYSKYGHVFNGWACTKSDSTSCGTFATGASIATATTTNGDTITLTATWTLKTNITCSAGKYLKAGIDTCNTTCPAGYKCPGGGSYTYNTTSDQGITLCGNNQWSGDGASTCESCPGSMTNSGNSASDHEYKSSCKITCTAGTFLDQSDSTCKSCTAGYYCIGGTFGYSDTSLQGRTGVCDANSYSTGGASASTCTPCAEGMTTQGSTADYHDHESDCKITCNAGTYLAKNASSCSTCPAGNYCSGGLLGFSSTSDVGLGVCDEGTYSTGGASVKTCTPCPGEMSNSGNSAANHAGKESCNITCAGGKYLPQSAASCSSCQAGYYCVGGTFGYSDTRLQGRTGVCGANSYSTGGASASTCTACPGSMTISGTNADDHDQKEDCQITCGAGNYLPANKSSCEACTEGHYCVGETLHFNANYDGGVTGCVDAGYYATEGCKVKTPSGASDGNCGIIEAGYWGQACASTGSGSGAVAPGYYSTGGGTSATGACLSNYECGLCDANSYSIGNATSHECTSCTTVDYDCSGTDATSTTTCPDGTTSKPHATATTQEYGRTCWRATSPAGSTSPNDCTGNSRSGDKYYMPCHVTSCATGYHKNSNSTECPANTFTVLYDAGEDGSGNAPTTPTSCTYDGTCLAPQNTFARTGYNFVGWICTSDANGSCGTIDPDENIANITTTNNDTITLTAKWAKNRISCPAGKYLRAGDLECTANCKVGYYCSGGDFEYNPTNDQGESGQCPEGFRDIAATSKNDCRGTFTKEAVQTIPEMPDGCFERTLTDCVSASCTYTKNYAGDIITDCTPTNCEKTQTCTKVNTNYCFATANSHEPLACSSVNSTYPKSDGGNITCASCYKVETHFGSRTNPTIPTGCAVQVLGECALPSCDDRYFADGHTELCNPGTCENQHLSCTSANINYYLDNNVAKKCSDFNETYPLSAGGNITSSYCYKMSTKTGTKENGTVPSGCYSVTEWNDCTANTCDYIDYYNATDGTCSVNPCYRTPKTVTANINHYVSGTTCPTCSSKNASYPYSDANNTGGWSACYVNVERACSQTACVCPANSTCTCNSCSCTGATYRQYLNAAGNGNGSTTGTTETEVCPQTLNTFTCNANYYKSESECVQCNVPFITSCDISNGYGNKICYHQTSEAGSTDESACTGTQSCEASCYVTSCNSGYHRNQTYSATSCVPNTFSVSYDAGIGGSGTAPTTPTSCTYNDTSCTAPANTYSRVGHDFNGWACTSDNGDCTKSGYATSASIGTATTKEDTTVTLTATWKPKIISCGAGTYLRASDATCQSCPAGKYCTGGDYTYDGTDLGITGNCDANTFSTGGASAKTCTSCTTITFDCSDVSTASTVLCPDNETIKTHATGTTQAFTRTCNRTTSNAGSTSESACTGINYGTKDWSVCYVTSCTTGYHTNTVSDAISCEPDGYAITYKAGDGGVGGDVVDNAVFDATFTTRPSNTFSKSNATFMGWSPSDGTYTVANTTYIYTTANNVTLTALWNCNPGYTLNDSTLACDPCAAGTYKGSIGNGACSIADKGYFAAGTANTVQTACVQGSYTSSIGQSACTACDGGKTNTGNGNATCSTNCNEIANLATWQQPTWATSNTMSVGTCLVETCDLCEKGIGTASCTYNMDNNMCNYSGTCMPGYDTPLPDSYTINCTPNLYVVTYTAGDGGLGNDATQYVVFDASFTTKPSDTFSKPNATFVGWAPSAGAYEQADTEYTYVTVDDITMTALWQCNFGYTLNPSTLACDPCAPGKYKHFQGNEACEVCPENYYCDGTIGASGDGSTSCSTLGAGDAFTEWLYAAAGSDAKEDCFSVCEDRDVEYGRAYKVRATEQWPTVCSFTGISETGNPCKVEDLADNICIEYGCLSEFEMIEGKCQRCNRQNATVYEQTGNCIVAQCVSGYHPHGDECVNDVYNCTASVPNATLANSTWDYSKKAFDICRVEECEDGYHVTSNTCVPDEQACAVPNGIGFQTWNTLANKWDACVATSCDAGYMIDINDRCIECDNKYEENGDQAVSSYVRGCEIASCMYQGEKYALINGECVPICTDEEDETGSKQWNPVTQKCEYTCSDGYTPW